MYQNPKNQNNTQASTRVTQEINAEKNDLPSQVGNELLNQLIDQGSAGNNGGTGNLPNSAKKALINAAENVIEEKPKKNKPLFYQDPENDIRNQEYEFDVDDDMAAEMDPNEKQEVSYSERKPDPQDDDRLIKSDLKEAEKDQYPVKNWNFTAQKMKDVKGTNWWTKFKNRTASFFGSIFGAISTSFFGIKPIVAAAKRKAASKKKKVARSKLKNTEKERSYSDSRLGGSEI